MQHLPAATWRMPAPSPPPRAVPWRRAGAPLLVALAIVLRAIPLAVPHFFFADEIFQYLETAHRLVFGQGVVTWEYRFHVRNWLLPVFLAGPMRLGDLLAPDSQAYLLLPKLALLALSLTAVRAAAMLGGRLSRVHAALAMLVVATWYEYVYFATQALTEAAAVPLFLLAAALADRGRAQRIAAGALLAAVAVLRFQYGPAVACFAGIVCVMQPRRIAPLALGALAALAAAAAMDLATGERPFGWILANVHENIVAGRSLDFPPGPFFYLQAIGRTWGFWLVPLLGLGLLGARLYPALAAAAAVNLAVHSCVAHKEYRYILLSTMIVALLAAIGTGEALERLRRRVPSLDIARLAWAAGIAWLLASASLAAGTDVRLWWTRGAPELRALAAIGAEPKLCGVALAGIPWAASGGYTYLHRAVPMLAYAPEERAAWMRDAAGYDAILAYQGTPLPPGFHRIACYRTADRALATCAAVRAGPCRGDVAAHEVNRMLVRVDR